MFTKKTEQDFFFSFLKNDKIVLEYGSGESTLEISRKVKHLTSLEHQEEWYNYLINKIPKNVNLILKKPNLPHTKGCGNYDQFKDYIEEPGKINMTFDIVLIDGRARIECARFIKKVCDDKTLIFVHDFTSRMDEHNYKEILNYLELIQSVDDMSLFKLKK